MAGVGVVNDIAAIGVSLGCLVLALALLALAVGSRRDDGGDGI
jgi:hypothetical protein